MILDIDELDIKVLITLLDHEIEQFPVESPVRDMLNSIKSKLQGR